MELVNEVEASEVIPPHTTSSSLWASHRRVAIILTRAAGHEVTDEQKQCEVNGIKGHMDKIDGIVTDVKSVSTYGC